MHFINIWKESLNRILQYYELKRGRISAFFPKLFVFFFLLNTGCYWLALLTAFPFLFYNNEVHYFKLQFPVGFLGALFDSFSFFVTVRIIKRALRCQGTLVYIAHLCIDFIIAVLATFWVLFVFSFSGWLIERIDTQIVDNEATLQIEIQSPREPQSAPQPDPLTEPQPEPPTEPQPAPQPEASTKTNDKVTVKPEQTATSPDLPEETDQTMKSRAQQYKNMLVEALKNPLGQVRYIYFGMILGISASLPTCLHFFMALTSLGRALFKKE